MFRQFCRQFRVEFRVQPGRESRREGERQKRRSEKYVLRNGYVRMGALVYCSAMRAGEIFLLFADIFRFAVDYATMASSAFRRQHQSPIIWLPLLNR